MKKAYRKDIWRTIVKSKKRFLSILIITIIGVTVFLGIHAACQDMYQAADEFYDEQNLFDIKIISTLGLTEADIAVLAGLPEIAAVEGSYNEEVSVAVGDSKMTADVVTISEKEVNVPYLIEGDMPTASGEIAVTPKYLEESGKRIGDIVEIVEKFDEEDETEKETEAIAAAAPASEDDDWDTEVDIEEEEESPSFRTTQYTITAEVRDPMDINNNNTSFRSSSTADYTFFVTGQDIDADIYTSVYIILENTRGMNCYSAAYEETVQTVIDRIEAEIKEQREAARYDEVVSEAKEKIADAEVTMNEKFAEAESEIGEAKVEIEDGRQELAEGESEFAKAESEARQKLADARQELEDGKAQLEEAESELVQGESELLEAKELVAENEATLATGKAELEKNKTAAAKKFAEAESDLEAQQAVIDTSRAETQAGIDGLQNSLGQAWPTAGWNALMNGAKTKTVELLSADPDADVASAVATATTTEQNNLAAALGNALGMVMTPEELTGVITGCTETALGMGIIEGSQQVLDTGWETYEAEKTEAESQLAAAEKKITDGEAELTSAKEQIEKSEQEIFDGWEQLVSGWQEIIDGESTLEEEEEKAEKELADAREELEEGRQELTDGEEELAENEEKFAKKKNEAEQKIADAYEELSDIDMTEWYLQDRGDVDSYSSLETDMSSIEVIGKTIPIVFIIVAVLISLTTMTRMIEEERGLIGTYKALGFSDLSIYGKYIIYAAAACISGTVLGGALGFYLFPRFLVDVLLELYILPHVTLRADIPYLFFCLMIFMVSIVGATVLACRSELKRMPAMLMRPKAPRNGSRVFLERIPFIWTRLKFLNKVTVRNLFRYKKRFFMTVFGIMGCTALIIAGFGIKSSVTVMMPKQYEDVYQFDLMAVVAEDDYAKLTEKFDGEEYMEDYMSLNMTSQKVLNAEGVSENVSVMALPAAVDLKGYLGIADRKGNALTLDESGVVITINAAELLGVSVGDTIVLQNFRLEEHEVTIAGIANNYLSNNIYMSEGLYTDIYGEYEENAVLANIKDDCPDMAEYAESFLKDEMMIGSMNVSAIRDDLMEQFTLMDAVVTMIIIFAAALAFVVLFTLSNTNISERIRELATTKVLGFYDHEVHSYVNKETLILTGIGVAIGLPMGWVLSDLLTSALKMPGLYFATYVEPIAYLYAAVLSFVFAFVVNLMTNRVLNKINMVEALKSVE